MPDDFRPLPGVPSSRDECRDGPRPCPYLKCRHHLWLKLGQDRAGNPTKATRPSTVFWPTAPASCSLDVAESGEQLNYRQVGELLGVTDEHARRIANRALAKLGLSVEQLGGRAPTPANDNAPIASVVIRTPAAANDNAPTRPPLVTIRRKEVP